MTSILDEPVVASGLGTLPMAPYASSSDETAREFATAGVTEPRRRVHFLLVQRSGGGIVSRSPGWLRQLAADLNRLLSLTQGWDGRQARPISETAVRALTTVLVQIMDVPPLHVPQEQPDIFPLPDGGLQAEWHAGGNDIEVEVEGDGATYVVVRDASGMVVTEGDVDLTALETTSPSAADEASRERLLAVRRAVERLSESVVAARRGR